MLLLLAFFMSSPLLQAQEDADSPLPFVDEKVTYTDVVAVDSVSASDLYSAAIEFFSSDKKNFRRSNSERNNQGANLWLGVPKKRAETVDALFQNENPVSHKDAEAKKIIVNVTNKYTGTSMGCIRIMYLSYDIIVKFKDNRYKYEVTNFNYTHYNQATMKQSQLYGMSDKGLCNSKNTIEELLNCNKCKKALGKLYDYINADTAELIELMNKSIIEGTSESDNDW